MELKLENISKAFGEKEVLNGAAYTFEQGKIYGLLGRNGAGKTTLFNCIAKDLLLDGGAVRLNGASNYDSQDIGYIHTMPKLPPFLTGWEFIKYFMDMHGSRLDRSLSATDYLEKIGIARADHDRLIRDYSHGMQNKVQMIAALMLKPAVLLLDEPLTSFDVVAAHDIKQLLLSIKSESIIIFSTHILPLAQELCDEIVLLHGKRLEGIEASRFKSADFEAEVIKWLSEDIKQAGTNS